MYIYITTKDRYRYIFQYTELGIHIVRIKTEYKETNKLLQKTICRLL